MPTKTFHNLPADKKKKLIEASLEEFSRVSFNEASINVIINKAGISRGSFYMYFEDKEDLFRFLLENHKEAITDIFRTSFKQENGDIFLSFKVILTTLIDYLEKEENRKFIKNVFMNLNMKHEEYIIPKHPGEMDENTKNEILGLVNTQNLNYQSVDDIIMIIQLLLMITTHTLMNVITNHPNKEEIISKYMRKLEMLQYGIERRELC